MLLTLIGEIGHVETAAVGAKILEVERLRKVYGRGRWRKRKGIARVRLADNSIHLGVGMEELASARKGSRSSASSKSGAHSSAQVAQDLVICIKNDGHEAALELRKIYRVFEDTEARTRCFLRIVDESGEDYLYPRGNFLAVTLPAATRRAVLAAG
jgi:hypothetical protein